MQIEGLDHLVLTVTNINHTCDFYERALGMKHVVFGEGRHVVMAHRMYLAGRSGFLG